MLHDTKCLWVLLLCLSCAQGDIYYNPRMGTVTTFQTRLNTVCLVPLSERPKVAVRIELQVASAAERDIISAGAVILRNKHFQPVNSEHRITIQYLVEDGPLHLLKVLLDGEEMEFVQSRRYDFADTYTFDHIAFNLRGRADIKPCETPPFHVPTYTRLPPTTTTTTTTTTAPPTTTTAAPTTTVVSTTTETPTTPQPTTTVFPPEEDVALAPREEIFPVYRRPEQPDESDFRQREVNTKPEDDTLGQNETFGQESNDTDSDDSDDSRWWDFIYIFGDFKRIPYLLILIIVFIVGLGLGSVTTLLCDQYCCCGCCDDDKRDDDDDNPGDLHYCGPDFLRPSANATFVGTVDPATGRLSKDNISPPLNSGGPRSPAASEAYTTPYQPQRERYLSADETLPLNSPSAGHDNQRMTNGSYPPHYTYQDTYQ